MMMIVTFTVVASPTSSSSSRDGGGGRGREMGANRSTKTTFAWCPNATTPPPTTNTGCARHHHHHRKRDVSLFCVVFLPVVEEGFVLILRKSRPKNN